jgi:hypothetical protein
MKKLLAIITIITLLTVPVALAADAPNLSTLSYDDLVSLKIAIEQELAKRPETKSVKVPQGTYIVGQHIPAGEYSITTNAMAVMITVYKDEDVSSIMNAVESHPVSKDQSVGRIILKDGQALTIALGSAIFVKYSGLGF